MQLGVLAHSDRTLGSGLGDFRRRPAAQLDESASDSSIAWRQVGTSRKAPKQVSALIDEGTDRLIVWGGDGTVRRCIDAIVHAHAAQVFPDARADDGRLDIGIVNAETRRDWLRVGARAVAGHLDASPLVEVTQGSDVKVRLDHKTPWELDGGDRPGTKKFDVTVLPGRVPVCVPTAS